MTLEGAAAALALAPIAFLGGFIQGLTGFGSALVTIPLATFFVPLPFALAVFAIVDFANGLRLGLENPRNALLGDIARMVPFMIAGIVTGTTLLVNLPRKASLVALGIFVLCYSIYALSRRGAPAIVSRNWAFFAGFCGGLSGTLFGAGGPPYAIYLSHRPLSKEQFRATMTLTTIFSIGLRIAAFGVTGLLSQDGVWIAAAAAIPAGLFAVYLASKIFRAISRETVMRGVAVLLLASGASLVVRGLA
ncbi:MAG TPA: sulfite exporter TauE/SafE family protein [Burkholderiales bacterium]|nr:sulfite exporter TauE/SafE family protein [Burkholderiales bacterium]